MNLSQVIHINIINELLLNNLRLLIYYFPQNLGLWTAEAYSTDEATKMAAEEIHVKGGKS